MTEARREPRPEWLRITMRTDPRFTELRSMVSNAEQRQAGLRVANEMDGPVFKMREDPRVTRVGQVLRQWSIDELPQLWNVLRGEMSLPSAGQ